LNVGKRVFDGLGLIPDVRVFDCTSVCCGERLRRSSGTTAVVSSLYEEGARVPLKPWQSLESNDLVFASRFASEFVSGNSIAVVEIPDELMRGIHAVDPFEDLPSVEEQLRGFVSQLTPDEQVPVRLIGPHSNKAALTTTTWNPETSKYIGLHLDSFYRLPFRKRHLSPNRLCLNIGGENRFFVFINLTLRHMHEILLTHRKLGALPRWNVSSVGKVFMQSFPRYPVIKLMVRPGEAYIAPTENLIHDSTTEEKNMLDVAVTLLGAFAPSMALLRAQGPDFVRVSGGPETT
jgi:hypothetical protein